MSGSPSENNQNKAHTMTRRQLLTTAGKGALALGVGQALTPLLGGSTAVASSRTGLARATASRLAARSELSATISLWDTGNSPSVTKWTNDYVLANFKKQYPGVTVQFVDKGSNQPEAVETAVAAGAGPTILYGDPTGIYPFEKAGDAIDMTHYASEYGWDSKFLPWALATAKYDGILRAVPERLESMIVYYSPPQLQKHGWVVPTTYDELVELCKEAVKAGLIPMSGGNSDWHPAIEWWLTSWWNNYAGPKNFYNALVGDASFADDAFVDAVANLKYFFDKKWIAGGATNFFANPAEIGQTDLAAGKAVLGPVGTWTFAQVSEFFPKGFEWEWEQLPPLSSAVPEPIFPLSVGALVAINQHASASEQQAAAAFINYYEANAEVSALGLANAGRELGSLIVPSSAFPASTPAPFKRFYEKLISASDRGIFGFATWTFLPAATDTYVYTALEEVVVGALSPKAYCQNIQAHMEKDRDSGNVIPAPKPTALFA